MPNKINLYEYTVPVLQVLRNNQNGELVILMDGNLLGDQVTNTYIDYLREKLNDLHEEGVI